MSYIEYPTLYKWARTAKGAVEAAFTSKDQIACL